MAGFRGVLTRIQLDWSREKRITMSRILDGIERRLVGFLLYALGVRFAVRYLRNPNPSLTPGVLRRFGANIGERVTFKGALYIDNATGDEHSSDDFTHIRIGSNCYIGEGVSFYLANTIELGDSVVLSGRVALLTHSDCNRSELLSRTFPRKCAAVTIGTGAWIGFGATVLQGVYIGEAAVVSSHSVVHRDVASHTLVGGVPGSLIRNLYRPEGLFVNRPLDLRAHDSRFSSLLPIT